MTTVQKRGSIFCGPFGNAVYLEAKGREAVWYQIVVGTAMAGISTVGGRPISHFNRSDAGRAKTVDDHRHTDRTAAITADGINTAIKIIFPTNIPLVIVEHGA